MSTKTVTLSLGERLAATKIFDAFKGGLSTLSALLDDVKKVIISPDEWEKAGLVKTPQLGVDGKPTGQESWSWKEDGNEKTIELEKESVDYLLESIKAKSEAKELTIGDINIVSLEKKLK